MHITKYRETSLGAAVLEVKVSRFGSMQHGTVPTQPRMLRLVLNVCSVKCVHITRVAQMLGSRFTHSKCEHDASLTRIETSQTTRIGSVWISTRKER